MINKRNYCSPSLSLIAVAVFTAGTASLAFGQSHQADNRETAEEHTPSDRIVAEAPDPVGLGDPHFVEAVDQLQALVDSGEMSPEDFELVMQLLRSAPVSEPRRMASGLDVLSIDWHTIDGGGGYSAGDDFELEGTIGQPDAGPDAPGMTGGDFELTGGFWVGTSTTSEPCLGDTNDDDLVDVLDLLALLAEWGSCPDCSTDLNDDDIVDVVDLLLLLAAWGPC